MLHIIKQYKKLILSFLETNFESPDRSGSNLNNNSIDAFIKDALKDKKLTSDERIKISLKYDEYILGKATIKEETKKDLKSYLEKSQGGKDFEIFKKYMLDKLSKPVTVTEPVSKVEPVVTTEQVAKVEPIVATEPMTKTEPVIETETAANNNISQKSVKTVEETSTDMKIDFGTGKTDFIGLRENINYSSYKEIVKNLGYEDLKAFVLNINGIAKSKNLNSEGRLSFTPFNIGDLKDAFAKIGYKADGAFGGIEMASLMELFNNVYKTQEKLNKSTVFTDKLAVLFDYNQDGLLDDDVHFYTKEKQFFDAIKTENQFENLLKNLGYQSKEEFNLSFENNYFAARSEFKNRLGNVLSVKDVINPSEMLKNPKALQEFNEAKLKAEVELENVLNTNEKTKNLPKETKDAIKLQAVGLVAGSAVGAGASFDISGLTNDIIDSLQIGIINGVPGIGIAKNIFKTKKGGFRVDVGAVNLIPMISASGVIKEAEYEEFKKLFPKEIDSKTQVTLTAAVSAVGSAVTLDFSKASEKTKLGIEKAKEKMSGVLDKVFDEIKSGKTFEQSSFKEEASNKAVYEGLTGLYKSNGSNPELVKYLKEGSLKNYERALYQNADGLNYSGVSVGLLFLSGYLPVPLVLVQGDYHRTEWKRVLPAGAVEESGEKEKKGEIIHPKHTKENLRSNFEKGTDINSKLSSFENAFSFATRYNEGALALMKPENDLNTRWEGLLKLSRGVKTLNDVGLNKFLKTVSKDNEKWLVISTISQYMKKAKDFNNGDIKSWNENTDKYIKIDKDRRKSFDTMMGFSLQNEANEYYSKLQVSKGKIDKTTIIGVGFDATSSINVEGNKVVKGMDTLYTNLSILTVNGQPLLIHITDKAKIDAFKEKVRSSKNISEDVKIGLITGIENGTVELNFYKDPEGFDDRILPIIKKTIPGDEPGIPVETPENPVIEVFQPDHSTIKVVGGYTGERREKTDDKPSGGGDGIDSTPGQDRTPNTPPANPTPTPAAPGTGNTEIPGGSVTGGFGG
ncbi:MAG: hypothetical protein PHV23_05550 [Candidatus Gracilibacteria bacterium]|nr:hypothetical protein [Candidatus Gracilibacteria bacterium]